MVELLGSVGWGLLAVGAITHVWHHRRLRELLAMHFDNERAPAVAITVVEVVLAAALPLFVITESSLARWFALAGTALAVGFAAWTARLLASGSDLPCACSFSQAPTTIWSLLRSLCVGLVALLAIGAESASSAQHVATLLVGWAVAAALFVLPEAVSWPAASRALLARVDAHT